MTTSSSWFFWAALSAVFAAMTAIFAKIGIQGVDSDLAQLRPRMYAENAHLKEADKPLKQYQFFVNSQDGYNRNIAELSLHQVGWHFNIRTRLIALHVSIQLSEYFILFN